ncbi:MAG: transposon-transfer assisting family protein [Lachnospiraceae bacterium]|nr:transposon-transfer assisting family protein [Lachnospiraceae bacterium]
MNFSVIEINLMCIFNRSSRKALLSDMTETLPYVEDPQMAELMRETMRHLLRISDSEFSQIEFVPAADDDGEWGDSDGYL